MNLTRLIILLLILNLFFIGLMVGITFVKQNPNPVAEFWGMSNNLSNDNNALSTADRFTVFLIRLQNASSYTVRDIYHHCSLVVTSLKMRIADLNIASFIPKRANPVVRKKSKLITGKAISPVHEPETNFANSEAKSLKQFVDVDNQKVAATVPSSVNGGRNDPFLNLGKKFQIQAEPKVKSKSQLKIESKPATGPKMAEVLKPAKAEEKPGAKILENFHLRGVVIGAVPIAYVEDQNGYHKFTIGDALADGKIIDINDSSLTFQIDGDQVVMKME